MNLYKIELYVKANSAKFSLLILNDGPYSSIISEI